MKINLNTIKNRVYLFIVIGIGFLMLFCTLIITQVVERQMASQYIEDKEISQQSLSLSLAPMLDLYDYEQIELLLTSSILQENIASVTVYNKTGGVIRSVTEQNTNAEDLDFEKSDITHRGGNIGSIEIGFTDDYISDQINTTTAALVFGLVGFFVLAGPGLLFGMDRTIIKPLGEFTSTVLKMGSKNLSTRVNIVRNDEIGKLATSFNQMADNVEKSYRELEKAHDELEDKVKERTRLLEEAKETADIANRAKSDFLSGMSHELRTPLNAVLGFSQVLQEQYFGKLNEKQADYIKDILDSGRHLLSLINDILDLSKIESGKMELELSSVRIEELIKNSLVMIKEKALIHGINLDICTQDLDNLEIMADERRLKQIMFNLLSNAAKFTPDGGDIVIEGRIKYNNLIVSVSDTGIGLSSEDREKVFEEFYQASGGKTSKTPGTGLGLPLTKSIIEMHGGRIWADSNGLGKGSRFTFTLPIRTIK